MPNDITQPSDSFAGDCASCIFYVYILASKFNGALFVGLSDDLVTTVLQHKRNAIPGLTSLYPIHRLVYVEQYRFQNDASTREVELKEMHRVRKLKLISEHNPFWRDLYEDLV